MREKHCSWLKIYDRLRASEQADGSVQTTILQKIMVQTTEEAFFICFFSSNSRDGNAVAMGLQQDQVFRVLVFTAEVQPGLAQQGNNC